VAENNNVTSSARNSYHSQDRDWILGFSNHSKLKHWNVHKTLFQCYQLGSFSWTTQLVRHRGTFLQLMVEGTSQESRYFPPRNFYSATASNTKIQDILVIMKFRIYKNYSWKFPFFLRYYTGSNLKKLIILFSRLRWLQSTSNLLLLYLHPFPLQPLKYS